MGDPGWFSRQGLALGEDGQRALRGLHVGIVGLGGTGSIAFTQLAHLGSNLSDPARTRVEMLPNPMGEEGEAVLNLLGEGLRYGFRRS